VQRVQAVSVMQSRRILQAVCRKVRGPAVRGKEKTRVGAENGRRENPRQKAVSSEVRFQQRDQRPRENAE